MVREEDIESLFAEYAIRQGYHYRAHSDIIPHGDPSTLFVTAGIQTAKEQVISQTEALNLATSQWCVRMRALDDVGYGDKLTSFKMLTTLSFGQQTREQHLARFFSFCAEVLGVDLMHLHFTASTGIDNEADDISSIRALEALGIPTSNISIWQRRWARPFGLLGPTGPNLFVSYQSPRGQRRPIWNLEFLDYLHDGTKFLPAQCPVLDCAGSVETVLSVRNDTLTPYEDGILGTLVATIKSDIHAGTIETRKLADHTRSIGLCLIAGIVPSARGRGAILRKLVTRALEITWEIGADSERIIAWVECAVELLGGSFSEEHRESLVSSIVRFTRSVAAGHKALDDAVRRSNTPSLCLERTAYATHSNLGFPERIMRTWFSSRGLVLNERLYEAIKAEHRRASRGRLGP